jgi:hypothetical protein
MELWDFDAITLAGMLRRTEVSARGLRHAGHGASRNGGYRSVTRVSA